MEKNITKEDRFNSEKYYSISNYQEIFKIGKSFYDDLSRGISSYAITSTGYPYSQQNTILGLASYFDQVTNLQIAIISDNLTNGPFNNLINKSKQIDLNEELLGLNLLGYRFYDHFDFINLEEIINKYKQSSIGQYDKILNSLSYQYDIIFWDVPELHKITTNLLSYIPVINKFQSVSIISRSTKQTNSKVELENIQSFFNSYGICLKGIIFETQKLKEQNFDTKNLKIRAFLKGIFTK